MFTERGLPTTRHGKQQSVQRPGGTVLFGVRSLYLLNVLALLVDEQLRVTDNVDEQDVTDFEFHV
jgi:hypothetical protein